MEVSRGQDGHSALVSAVMDPALLILLGYLTFVAAELVWVTRMSIRPGIKTVSKQPQLVRARLVMALISLLVTWTYMIRYLFWSYDAYVERICLTGGELTTLPQCGQSWRCTEKLVSARLMRMSSWLQDTSLFEEAWLYVVGGTTNWWWSVEVCLFTVGFWALQMRQEGRLRMIPHLWPYMVLGQTVAISVAMNLFNTAVASSDALVPNDSTNFELHSNGKPVSPSPLERTDSQRMMPPPSSTSTVSTMTTAESHFRYSPPRYGDFVFCALTAASGLLSVARQPSDLVSILAMHLCPLLAVLPFRMSTHVVWPKWRKVLCPSTLFSVVAAASLLIRIQSHRAAWSERKHLLTIFLSHPAQTSISADAVCLTLSAMMELYILHNQEGRQHAKFFISLLAATPTFGPSFTMASAYAVLSRRQERELESQFWSVMEKSDSLRELDLVETRIMTSTVYPIESSTSSGSTRSPNESRRRRSEKA